MILVRIYCMRIAFEKPIEHDLLGSIEKMLRLGWSAGWMSPVFTAAH